MDTLKHFILQKLNENELKYISVDNRGKDQFINYKVYFENMTTSR